MSSPTDRLSPAQVRLWADLGLAVIDIETAQDPRGGYRVVDVAVMTCRRGGLVGRWTQWVNPEIPIDDRSTAIHGITDETVAEAPVFDDIADRFLAALTPEAGETLVVVAHNASFDLPILRSELLRVGTDLPDLPVIDTARDLPAFVGVAPLDRSLAALCQSLGVTHSPQHQSVGDTFSLAQAAISLLGDAADQGHDRIADILKAVGTETGDYQRQPRHISPMDSSGVAIPDEHWVAHLDELTSQATSTQIDDWKAALADCARLRCEEAEAFLAGAQVEPKTVIEYFDEVIQETSAGGDVAGVATLLGAGMPYIRDHLETITTTRTRRNAAVKRFDRWQQEFATLGQCQGGEQTDLCPDCLDYLPCPLDTWIDTLATVAVGIDQAIDSFYPLQKSDRTGSVRKTFYRWTDKGRKPLADAGLAAVVEHWVSQGELLNADRIAEAGWEDGCRHPVVATRWAGLVAAPRREQHLEDAIAICVEVMANRNGSTAVGWVQLDRLFQRLSGQLARLNDTQSGQRSRRPTQPKRTHPNRFISGAGQSS